MPPKPAENNVSLNSMLLHVECKLQGDFMLNKQNTSAEYFEEYMRNIMLMAKDDEAINIFTTRGISWPRTCDNC